MKRRVAAVLMTAGFALGIGAAMAPSASADCTDLGGNGSLCTTGDPATGSFGARLRTNQGVHVCLVVFASCP
jgi:hypothetical protein